MNRKPNPLTALLHKQYFWGIIAILLLLIINLIKDPTYLNVTVNQTNGNLVGNVIDILRASAPVMMIAIGMCLVVATKGIDLSVGSVMVVAGAVSMELLHDMPNTAGSAFLALLLALGIATVLGLFNGFLVSVVGLQPFISTLVMMLAGRGIAKVITGGQNTASVNGTFRWFANGYVLGFPVIFILAVLITIAVGLLVRRSALGLMIEAIGMDPKAARLAGVNRRGLQLMVYSLSGLLAGIAGVFATASVMTVDVSRTGNQMELDAILAVVIGGTSLAGGKFNLTGAFVGSLLIATLDKTVVFLGVSSSATPAFKAIVIVVICLLQSERIRNAFKNRKNTPTPAPETQKDLVAA